MDEDFIRRYTSETANLLRTLDPGPILAAVTALHEAWKAGKVVLFCGNGGSGASCSHIVNDLQKNIATECGKPLKAICLSDCQPLMNAWANDLSWNLAFEKSGETWYEPGGVMVALSGSGRSLNVLRAVDAARCAGMVTVGLTGMNGSELKELAEISIHVPTDSMQHAEDVHMVILHMLFLGLQQRIKEGAV